MARSFLSRAAVLTCVAILAGCRDGPPPGSTAARLAAARADVVDRLAAADMGKVGTFLQAVQAAGLVDALSDDGPFTVFAPTNDAFAALPPGMMEDLLSPDHKAQLRALVLYHVHAGDAVLAADVRPTPLSTAAGPPVAVGVVDGTVTVNAAKVIKADIVCTNGVIHWVDKVLIPPTPAAGAAGVGP